MLKKIIFTIIVMLSFLGKGFCQHQDYETFTYFKNDSLSLDLDLFLPDAYEKQQKLPIVIFVHGGGFSAGARSNGHGLARYLVKNNIACASITYTLHIKENNLSFSCDGVVSEKMKAMQIAVSQLWHATSYFLKNSEKFNIDTNKIFIAGSSAGAETVLHAPYWNPEKVQLFGKGSLPAEFRYAGVIGGAGAITDINLINCDNQVPMMLIHGDNDRLVPFGTAAHHYCNSDASGWLMMFGSQSIANRIESLGGTCKLIAIKGGGHECAGKFIHADQHVFVGFIQRILANEQFITFQTIKEKTKS